MRRQLSQVIFLTSRMLWPDSHGRMDSELELCNKHISLDPENEKALYLRAQIHAEYKRFAQCSEDCTALIALNPHCSKYYFMRAQAQVELGELHKAENDFETSIKLSPNCKEVYFQFGCFMLKRESYEKALELIEQGLTRDEESQPSVTHPTEADASLIYTDLSLFTKQSQLFKRLEETKERLDDQMRLMIQQSIHRHTQELPG